MESLTCQTTVKLFSPGVARIAIEGFDNAVVGSTVVVGIIVVASAGIRTHVHELSLGVVLLLLPVDGIKT